MTKENQLKMAKAIRRGVEKGAIQHFNAEMVAWDNPLKVCVLGCALLGAARSKVVNEDVAYRKAKKLFGIGNVSVFYKYNDRRVPWAFEKFISVLSDPTDSTFDAA